MTYFGIALMVGGAAVLVAMRHELRPMLGLGSRRGNGRRPGTARRSESAGARPHLPAGTGSFGYAPGEVAAATPGRGGAGTRTGARGGPDRSRTAGRRALAVRSRAAAARRERQAREEAEERPRVIHPRAEARRQMYAARAAEARAAAARAAEARAAAEALAAARAAQTWAGYGYSYGGATPPSPARRRPSPRPHHPVREHSTQVLPVVTAPLRDLPPRRSSRGTIYTSRAARAREAVPAGGAV